MDKGWYVNRRQGRKREQEWIQELRTRMRMSEDVRKEGIECHEE